MEVDLDSLTGVFGVADAPSECDTATSCDGEGELVEMRGKT